jgi:hypothetical protein
MGGIPQTAGAARAVARVKVPASPFPAYVIYTSTDLATWTVAPADDSLGFQYLHAFDDGTALMGASPSHGTVAYPNGGILFTMYAERRTTDSGASWGDGYGFESSNGQARGGIFFARVDRQTAFSFDGADTHKLFLTRDRGATWETLETIQATSNNAARFLQTDGRYLFYIDNNSQALWRRPLADYGVVVAAEDVRGGSGLELAIAPNPARGAVRLSATLPQGGEVRITLDDVLGRQLELLFDDAVAPGATVEAAVEGSRLAPGLYVVRLTTPAGAISRTLTLAR